MANAPYYKYITVDAVIRAYAAHNYQFNANNYGLNIFAIRTDDATANTFNDVVGVVYEEDGVPQLFVCDATTDPGLRSRTSPVNQRGTAIIVPGQYQDAWRLGLHKGQYQALVQQRPIKLYRDNNKDGVLDTDDTTIVEEIAGINLHRATPHQGNKSKLVDSWSAGCMVIAAKDDWDEFMRIVTSCAARTQQSSFTITLFTEQEFFDE